MAKIPKKLSLSIPKDFEIKDIWYSHKENLLHITWKDQSEETTCNMSDFIEKLGKWAEENYINKHDIIGTHVLEFASTLKK